MKIQESLHKADGVMLILIPFRIETRCIINAKSCEAKKRLVHAAIMATFEDMRRYTRADTYVKRSKPIKKSFTKRIKDFLAGDPLFD